MVDRNSLTIKKAAKTLSASCLILSCLMPSFAHGEGGTGIYMKLSGGKSKATVGTFGTDQAKHSPWMGQLASGAGYEFPNGLYVGGELFVGRDSHPMKNAEQGDGITTHLEQKHEGSLGAAALVGYTLGRERVYARLGLEYMLWSRFLHDVDHETGSIDEKDSLHQTKSSLLMVPGIGWQHKLSEGWSISAEYQYALPKKIKKMTSEERSTWSFQRLLVGVSFSF